MDQFVPLSRISYPTAPLAAHSQIEWRWNPDAKLAKSGPGAWVVVNYSTATSLTVSNAQGRLLAEISGLSVPFILPPNLDQNLVNRLVRARILLTADEFSEYEDLIKARLAAALRQSYGFIIMPTEKCNFGCDYCYESFSRGRMSEQAASALSKAIKRTAATAPQFSLAFFGGEPLLCPDLVLRFSQEAFEIMHSRGLPYTASIATNGSLLTASLFTKLVDSGVVCYQITLDGPPALHNQKRPLRGGGHTSDTVVQTLKYMASTDVKFSCVVRCNAHQSENGAALEYFMSDHVDFLRSDRRFVLDLHSIWASDRQELSSTTDKPTLCSSGLIDSIDYYAFNRELEQIGIATASYQSLPGILGKSCYAGKPNWFVVGADLALYKCTVVFDNEKNQLGRIADDGVLLIDSVKNTLWCGSNALTDCGCGGCHYRVPCGGIACPLTRFTSGNKSCPPVRTPSEFQRWADQRPFTSEHHTAKPPVESDSAN